MVRIPARSSRTVRWWLIAALAVVVISGALAARSPEVGSGGTAAATSVTPTVTTTVPVASSTTVGSTTVPVVTSTSVGTTTVPVATSTSTSTSTPAPSPVDADADLLLLSRLSVREEPARQGYDRRLFPHWQDVNGSGCNARQDMLLATAIGFVQVDLFDRCVVVEGDWASIYDGVVHEGGPGEMDVDHVVSLAEAWDSGAQTWDQEQRRQFANDAENLLVVTAASNRSKGDRDVGEWRPSQKGAWCLTAQITVRVKYRYGLSVDPVEARALVEMLGTCTGAATGVADGSADGSAPRPEASCIDLNAASFEELQSLIHIGPERARQIVDLRPLASVRDLLRVQGIGESRLADIIDEGLVCP